MAVFFKIYYNRVRRYFNDSEDYKGKWHVQNISSVVSREILHFESTRVIRNISLRFPQALLVFLSKYSWFPCLGREGCAFARIGGKEREKIEEK